MSSVTTEIPDDFVASAQRAVEACTDLSAADTARRLAEDGLLGVLAGEDVGGLGLPMPFALPVAGAGAGGLCAFPLTETLLAARALQGGHPAAAQAIVEGREIATIAWAGSADGRILGPVAWAEGLRWLLARADDGTVRLLDLAATAHTVAPAISLEVDRQMVVLTLADPATDAPALDAEAAAALRDGAVLLRAAELLAGATVCFEQARTHVETRRQFGRPLAAFQVIRHDLARYTLWLEGLRRTLDGAARRAGTPAGALAARAAFAAAADHAPTIIEGTIQLNGAMGFTWDLDLHRHLRRARAAGDVLDLTGARDWLAADLIDGTLPLDPAETAALDARQAECA